MSDDAAITRALLDISEKLGAANTGIKGLHRRLDEAAVSRGIIKDHVEDLQARVGRLETDVQGVKEESHKTREFINRSDIKEAERRGAMEAVKAIWRGTTWTGRGVAAIIAVALLYAGDAVATLLKNAIDTIVSHGPG
jgi:hypothetical protein